MLRSAAIAARDHLRVTAASARGASAASSARPRFALSQSGFAGANTWSLPKRKDLKQLYDDISIEAGDPRLESFGLEVPFWHLQPGFYWSCERDDGPQLEAPCDPGLFPGYAEDGSTEMRYSVNFDNGFEGTDLPNKQFYVMVYFPAAAAQ